MKSFFCFPFLFLLFISQASQAQSTFYANYDPSPGNQVYFGGFQRILATPDNGFAALSGTYEKVIAKLNANMEVEWAFRFDAPGTQTTFGVYDMTISNDGKIMVLGYGGAGNDYAFLAKLNLDGTLAWNKKVSSDYNSCGFHLVGKQILNAYDNGFLMLGSTSDGHSMALRLDEDGDEVWSRVYDNTADPNSSRINNGLKIGNNSFLLQSTMRSYSYLTIDANGNLLQETHYDDGRSSTYPKILAEGPNGDYFSVGLTRDSSGAPRRQLLNKINASGGLIWSKQIEVDSTLDMYEPYALFALPNNEIVLLGYFTPQSGGGRMTQFSRWDVNGNHLGTVVGWDAGTEYLYGGSYINGSIYLAGISLADRNMIARVDLNGNGICNTQSVGMNTVDLSQNVLVTSDQIVVTNMPTDISDLTWSLVPYSYSRNVVCGSTMVSAESSLETPWNVYPQPATGDFFVEHPSVQEGAVELLDLSGRVVWQGILNAHNSQTRIPRGQWADGMYLLRMQSKDRVETRRVVLR